MASIASPPGVSFLSDAVEEFQMHTNSNSVAGVMLRTDIRLRAEAFEDGYHRLRRLPYSALRDVADGFYAQLIIVR